MRRIHTKPNNGLTVDWLTPPEIISRLGAFDLDPCAHPGQFYATATKMIAPPLDGLSTNWTGRVWLNPPYGQQIDRWMKKMVEHGNGERWFWPYVWEAATAILFLRGRIYFYRPDGTRRGNAGHGSVLVAYGLRNVIALQESGIVGRLIS